MLHYRQIELEVSAPSVRRKSAQSVGWGGVRGQHSLGLITADFAEVASLKFKLLGFGTLGMLREMRTFTFLSHCPS